METTTIEKFWIGAGIGYRARYRDELLSGDFDLPLLEVIPQHFFANPSLLDALADRFSLIFHDTDLPLATLGDDQTFFDARLNRIATLTARVAPTLFSSHLALTSAPSHQHIGHLAPLWYTQKLLDSVSARVIAVQDRLQIPVILENLSGFLIPNAEMTEAEFLTRLVEKTQCGLLLDLSNILVNARNRGLAPKAHVDEYPLEAALQVHLAGGVFERGLWIDSHSTAVEDESFALLDCLKGRANLQTIVVERDQEYPPLRQLVDESIRAARLWKNNV